MTMPAPGAGHLVECDTCHAMAVMLDGQRPHDVLKCRCCPEDHDHREAASASGTPCRPVTLHVGAVSAQLGFLGGGS